MDSLTRPPLTSETVTRMPPAISMDSPTLRLRTSILHAPLRVQKRNSECELNRSSLRPVESESRHRCSCRSSQQPSKSHAKTGKIGRSAVFTSPMRQFIRVFSLNFATFFRNSNNFLPGSPGVQTLGKSLSRQFSEWQFSFQVVKFDTIAVLLSNEQTCRHAVLGSSLS